MSFESLISSLSSSGGEDFKDGLKLFLGNDLTYEECKSKLFNSTNNDLMYYSNDIIKILERRIVDVQGHFKKDLFEEYFVDLLRVFEGLIKTSPNIGDDFYLVALDSPIVLINAVSTINFSKEDYKGNDIVKKLLKHTKECLQGFTTLRVLTQQQVYYYYYQETERIKDFITLVDPLVLDITPMLYNFIRVCLLGKYRDEKFLYEPTSVEYFKGSFKEAIVEYHKYISLFFTDTKEYFIDVEDIIEYSLDCIDIKLFDVVDVLYNEGDLESFYSDKKENNFFLNKNSKSLGLYLSQKDVVFDYLFKSCVKLLRLIAKDIKLEYLRDGSYAKRVLIDTDMDLKEMDKGLVTVKKEFI